MKTGLTKEAGSPAICVATSTAKFSRCSLTSSSRLSSPARFGEEEDKLWLFSEMEVFGEHDWTENDPDRGFQFEYFKDRRNRIKVDENGTAHWWWERSPSGSDSDYFCIVSSSGDASHNYADITGGVCFGFYI